MIPNIPNGEVVGEFEIKDSKIIVEAYKKRKHNLIKQINQLPLFETHQIAVKHLDAWIPQTDFQAIVEQGKSEAVAVLKKGYKLIQLRDALRDIVEKLPEIDGKLFYYRGRADLYVYPENENIGIYAVNSVDGTTALRVDFAVQGENSLIFIPRKFVPGLRRIHRGKVLTEFENFLKFIGEVKEAWRAIVEKLSSKIATEEDIKAFSEIIGKRGAKKLGLWLELRPSVTVWDLAKETLKIISQRKYKTEIHRNKKVRQISFAIFAYALKN